MYAHEYFATRTSRRARRTHRYLSGMGRDPMHPAMTRSEAEGQDLARLMRARFRRIPGSPALSEREMLDLLRRQGLAGMGEMGFGFHFGNPFRNVFGAARGLLSTAARGVRNVASTAVNLPSAIGLPGAPTPGFLPSYLRPGGGGGTPGPADLAAQAAMMAAQAQQYQAPAAAADLSTYVTPPVAPLPAPSYSLAPAPDLSTYVAPPMAQPAQAPDMYQAEMPSPAQTVDAYAPDVNASPVPTVPDVGYTQPDVNAGYSPADMGASADMGTPAPSDGSLQGMGWYRRPRGLGADPTGAAAAPGDAGWGGLLQNLAATATGIWQQKKLADINLTRAQQGLPPITASDAGVGAQVSVGLDPATRNMIIGGVAIAGLATALVMMRKKRR